MMYNTAINPKEMFKEAIRTIYPRKCPGCRDVILPNMLVCDDCAGRFKPVEPPFCMKCGRHVEDEETELCDDCMAKDHRYSMGFSVFVYDGIMRQAMADLKYASAAENADYFADITVKTCGERIKLFNPDVIIPVPIHPSRRAERGYNQAQLISDRLSGMLGIPAVNDLLLRTRKTAALKILDAAGRAENLKQAFSCDLKKYPRDEVSVRFGRVLLVDDIYTTGTTMECCTEALLDAGVKRVAVLSVAIGYNY